MVQRLNFAIQRAKKHGEDVPCFFSMPQRYVASVRLGTWQRVSFVWSLPWQTSRYLARRAVLARAIHGAINR